MDMHEWGYEIDFIYNIVRWVSFVIKMKFYEVIEKEEKHYFNIDCDCITISLDFTSTNGNVYASYSFDFSHYIFIDWYY